MTGFPTWIRRPTALAVTLLVCGCGDSSMTDNAGTDTPSTAVATSFPTGLAVDSPTAVSTSTASAAHTPSPSLGRYARDGLRAVQQAWAQGHTTPALARVFTALLPMSTAQAQSGRSTGLHDKVKLIEKVLAGDASVPLSAVLDVDDLFAPSSHNATCYGPALQYTNHEDAMGGPNQGTLPSGDLGLWLPTEGDTSVPCIAAQFDARVSGVRRQTQQGLLMMAAMRKTIAQSPNITMPKAGETVNLRLPMTLVLGAAFAGRPFIVKVDTATVSLDTAGKTYTYRLVLNNNKSRGEFRQGEILLHHTPGTSASTFEGLLQVSGFQHSADPALGCTDTQSEEGDWFQTARISSVKYARNGQSVQFSSRSGQYCGHPTDKDSTNYGAQVADFQSDGQLDPGTKLSGSVRHGVRGWRGNFERFAGDYDHDEATGNFLYTWQAGTGDSHARALAATSTLNTATGDRTVQGYFGFSGEISTPNASTLQGMICNWAGPGNRHVPALTFQSQSAVLSHTSSRFILSGTSRITYAPTNSCSSDTTSFDVNLDLNLSSGEGVGLTADLDQPTAGRLSVDAELRHRGWGLPALY